MLKPVDLKNINALTEKRKYSYRRDKIMMTYVFPSARSFRMISTAYRMEEVTAA